MSFHTFIALVHPLHDNPYSSYWHQLMGIYIAHWLAALMGDLLPLCLLHTSSTIILYSTCSAIFMACAHVLREGWKGWSALKSMNQLLGLSSGLCMMGAFCVTKLKHGQTIWFCRDKLALALLFWKDMIALLVRSKYYCFMSNDRLLLWITRVLIFMPWLDYLIKIMLGSIPHQKLSFLSFTYSRTSRN